MEYKTVWISNLRLGTDAGNAAGVLDLLRRNEFQKLYLLGGAIDNWHRIRDCHWPHTHHGVVQQIFRRAREGTRIVFIPENPDEFLDVFLHSSLCAYSNVAVRTRDGHVTANGRRLLVMQGHELVAFAADRERLARFGEAGRTWLRHANRSLHFLCQQFGPGHRPLERRVNSTRKSVNPLDRAVRHFAERDGADGLITGHRRTAAARNICGITHYDCGNWVENGTLLVEDADGSLRLVHSKETGFEIVGEPMAPLTGQSDSSDLSASESGLQV